MDRRSDAKTARLSDDERDRRAHRAGELRDVVGSAARVQMLRYQVVGQMRSWLSNRAREFQEIVDASTLSRQVQHQLCSINQQEAWFSRFPITIHGETCALDAPVRKLARTIMKAAMARHKRPSWNSLPVQLDRREAIWIQSSKTATQGGKITHWLRISAPGAGKISVPLQSTRAFLEREGKRASTIQIGMDEADAVKFALVTDITDECVKSRSVYVPRMGGLGLDFGLVTLFATSSGDLIGRSFLSKLKKLDATLSGISRHATRSGKRPRDSKRYRKQVVRTRGFLKTEICRVLNRLMETHAPSEILVEKLDFRFSELGRDMNRLLSNCGRAIVRDKLQDIEDRLGVHSNEQDSAYTSQECSSCGHVHKSNRKGQTFRCRRCGLSIHADVNAARNIAKRRSLAKLDTDSRSGAGVSIMPRGRSRILERLHQAFKRRHGSYGSVRSGGSDSAADLHANPLRFAWDEVTCKTQVMQQST